jgi:hypothetical protein
MMDLLNKRGSFMEKAKYEKVREIEKQINALKNEKFEELTKPRSAFVVFETQKAAKMAAPWYFTNHVNFMGKHKLEIREASHPSQIIWEDFTPTKNMNGVRKAIILSIIVIMEIGLLVFFINLYQINMQIGYLSAPPGVHCDLLSEGMHDIAEELAFKEYK